MSNQNFVTENRNDELSKKLCQSLEDESSSYNSNLENSDLPTPNISPSSKKRRPISSEVIKQRIESGKWRRQEMIGSSLRFLYFDELMEGDKSLELIICRLCDSTYSIHSRSHCLDHIKQRHPEVNSEKLINNKINEKNNDDVDVNLNSSCNNAVTNLNFNVNDKNNQTNLSNANADQNQKFAIFESGSSINKINIASPIVKRRRLITTEMARSRLQAGEWQLRSVAGASVRCRFFFEIYEGDTPLNTLSCKLCGATYSTQSRSHYREHVRRRHSEVYCVRNGRVSTPASFFVDQMNKTNNESINGEGIGNADNEEEDTFINNFQNTSGYGDFVSDSNNLISNNLLFNENHISNMPQNPQLKMRRIITTETVVSHLEAGDWLRKPISGMSIRSRFFDEIVEGQAETPLNILICKLCGSTYSAQSRSHCVEHVKKRHQSILEGNKDAEDFEMNAWIDTQKMVNLSTLTVQNHDQQQYSIQQHLLNKSNLIEKNKQTFQQQGQKAQVKFNCVNQSRSSPINNALTNAQRKRKLLIPISGPDQTIETPSIDSILQSLATQALSQETDNSGDIDDDCVESAEYKFDLSTINNIINGEIKNNNSVSKKRNLCEENELKEFSKKSSINSKNNSLSNSPLNTVEQNDMEIQMRNSSVKSSVMLSNSIASDENIKQSITEVNKKNQTATNSFTNDQNDEIAKNNNEVYNSRLSPYTLHQQFNKGLNRTNSYSHPEQLFVSSTNSNHLYNVPNLGSGNNGHFYQNSFQRQQMEFRQKQMFEMQHQRKNFIQLQQQRSTQFMTEKELNFVCNTKQNSVLRHSLNNQSTLGNYNTTSKLHKKSNAVPAGLLPPSFSNSRVIPINVESNNNSKSSFLSFTDNNQSNIEDCSDFCKNCKSEFPNVVRGLNQLYDRVNDLMEVMHLALGSIRANQPHNVSIAKALEKLESTAITNNTMHNMTETKTMKNTLIKTKLTDFNKLSPNIMEEKPIASVSEIDNIVANENLENDEIEKLKKKQCDQNYSIKKIKTEDVCDERIDDNFNSCSKNSFKTIKYLNQNFSTSGLSKNIKFDNNDTIEDRDDETKNLEEDMHNEEQMDPVLKALLNNETSSNDEDEINNGNNESLTNSASVIENSNENECEGSSFGATSSKINNIYLSFLEKEILKSTPNEFTVDDLNNKNSIVKKAQSNKVMSALKNLMLRGLLEKVEGQEKFFKNIEKIQQFNKKKTKSSCHSIYTKNSLLNN